MKLVDRRQLTTTDGLSASEQAQLAAIGVLYFGGPGPVAIDDDVKEDPFEARSLSCVDLWRVLDGETHVYDAWFYMSDSGVIFEAGTAEPVAEVIQVSFQCSDPALRVALGVAMVEAGAMTREDPSYRELAALAKAKEPATKKTLARKKTPTRKK